MWVSKCEYPAKHVIKPHRHNDYYHMIFVLNGAGNIVLDDSAYKAKINQLYIVKPSVRHGIYAFSAKPLNTVEFKFSFSNDYTDNVLKLLPDYYENTSENAKKLLADSDKNVTDIAFEVGFQSVHYFSRYFKNHEGYISQ